MYFCRTSPDICILHWFLLLFFFLAYICVKNRLDLYIYVCQRRIKRRIYCFHTYVLVLGAQALSGDCGAPCEKQLGLPSAEHSQFQLDPTGPPQGTAEPHRHDGGRQKRWMERGIAQGTQNSVKEEEEIPHFSLYMASLSLSTSNCLYLWIPKQSHWLWLVLVQTVKHTVTCSYVVSITISQVKLLSSSRPVHLSVSLNILMEFIYYTKRLNYVICGS